MTDPRNPFEPTDETDDPVGDATLDRAIGHLRSMPTPPVPADLFAGVQRDADAAPTPIDRQGLERAASDRRGRRLFVVAVASLAVAVLVAVGIGFALMRFGAERRQERDVAQNDPSQADPSPDIRGVPTQIAIEPHPRLRTLADETADLQERVRSLRHRAEATAARRQAERLLRQYAGR